MKKKDIILISIIIILLIVIVGLLIYFNNTESKNIKELTIEAEVLIKADDYLIVTTDDEEDYVINTKDVNYNVGDRLKLELTDVDEDKMPIEATAKKITVIKEIDSKVEDNQDEKVVPPEEDTTSNPNNGNTINTTETQNYTEEDVIEYFNSLDAELTNYKDDETLSRKIKTNFVKCIDFIFYGGTIGGKTFNELSNSAKLTIIKLALSIDNKIDSIFPGYKDTISTSYQNIKNKLIEKYLDITTTICTNDKDLCINAKEGFKELKASFGLTWNTIKSLAGQGTEKLKNWYEIWRYN